jgi:hypothetical protein
MCAFWKYAPQDRKLDLTGSPRILIVQSELDPATAYEGSLRTHDDTKNATRLCRSTTRASTGSTSSASGRRVLSRSASESAPAAGDGHRRGKHPALSTEY